MCFDPATITAMATKIGTALAPMSNILTLVGTGVSAYAQMQNARRQAQVASINAEASNKASIEALEAGERASDMKRRRGAAMMANQRASMAANGVDVSSGDAVDFLDDTNFMVEEDAFTIRENARGQGQNLRNQGANFRADAASARSASVFNPVSTLLTGAATILTRSPKVGARYADWSQGSTALQPNY